MNYRLELLIHDESFNAYEKIEADSLTELLAQFLLVVARIAPVNVGIINLTASDEFVLNKDEVLALLKELKYSYIDYDNELAVKIVRNMIRRSEQ